MRSSVLVGVDLVSISRIRNSLERFGPRFTERFFTVREIEYCQRDPEVSAERFAARFAAKEAALKVLRIEVWPDLKTIEVRRSPEGWCDLALHGEALRLAERAHVGAMSVSLSHEGDSAIAVVVGTVTSSATSSKPASSKRPSGKKKGKAGSAKLPRGRSQRATPLRATASAPSSRRRGRREHEVVVPSRASARSGGQGAGSRR